MKRTLLTAATLTASIGAGSSMQAGIIDVNLTRTGTSPPSETGFTDWATGDNSAPTDLVTGGLTLSAVDFNAGSNLRSIDRAGDDGYAGTLASLTQTWWGQRASTTGAGGFITIDISGLAAGSYIFTSWHLDHENQTGGMKIEFSDDNGVSFTDAVTTFDLVSGDESATAPIEKSFNFTSTGADIQIRFTNTNVDDPDGVNSAGTFALVNGFSVAVPEPSSLALLGLGGLCMLKRRRRD